MNGFEQCNKCMQITNNRQRNKKIIVQIIDKCAACKIGKAIDLTPGAFKKLAPNENLDVGVLDISFKPVKCPSGGIFDVLAKLL
jgi:rare lipoprotein A (peptidoglycan hydrolase)